MDARLYNMTELGDAELTLNPNYGTEEKVIKGKWIEVELWLDYSEHETFDSEELLDQVMKLTVFATNSPYAKSREYRES